MNFDVVIVGAGPVGLSFAKALSNTSLNVAIIDRQTSASLASPSEDGREIALTHLSKKILTRFGIWQEIDQNEISLIKEAKVIEESSNQILDFTREVKNLPKQDKIKIIEALWSIIYSNKDADIYETNLMRRLAGLLYIDNKTMGDIKEKIKQNLK